MFHLLSYEPNDAGGPPAQNIPGQREIQEGETAQLSSLIPNRTGYRFSSWNTMPDGTGTAYQPGQTAGPFYTDLIIYAQWQRVEHILTYHGNDAGGPAAQNIPGPVMVPDGQSVTLSNTIPTREGFAFSGWDTNSGGTGTTYRPGDTIPDVRANISLHAQWIPLPPTTYTLTYCGNDTGGPSACCIPCPQQVPAGQYVWISCCMPYRACYCFTGWNTDPCGRGQMIYLGQAIEPVIRDIWLYAQWRRLPPPRPCYICRSEPG